MKSIGFIGTGVMGGAMAENLMKAGYSLFVHSRTKSRAEPLLRQSAVWCESPAQCAKGRDAVITMVGFPADVSQVYLGEEGILEGAQPGTYLIDMTTTSPQLSRHIAKRGGEKGLHVLDAPVSGGDSGAKNGTLSIMVGGEEADFAACLPLFQAMGENIVYQGAWGSGQHTKMANQIALAGALAGVAEALAYVRCAGLDEKKVLGSIGKGAAGSWQMEHNAPKMMARDFAPGFYCKHFVKDMRIAMEEGEEMGIYLNVLADVLDMYEVLEQQGKGDLGTQALIEYYEGE